VPGDSFTVFHARRTFDLSSVPARFVVHVSADNRYRLYVNGVQVSSGPQRSDVTHWRYETLDLAPHLRAGRNVIAALVWNWGAARPVAQHSNRTGFLLQGNGQVEAALVNTGTGWKLLRDPAYAPIEALRALPGMTEDLAEQLIAARQQIAPGMGATAGLTMPDGSPIMANGGGNTYTIRSRATLANGASALIDASVRLGGIGVAGRPYTVLRWRDDESSR